MNIGFDIDGVLTDVSKFQIEYGKKFFKNRELVNENGYSIREMFDCTKEEEYDFWKHNLLNYTINFPPRIGVAELFNKLKLEGHKIFIISSRIKSSDNDFIGKLIRKLVKQWFKKNNIPYDKIFFCSIENSPEEKSKCCIENKIDYMVEDTIANMEEIRKVTKVICFSNKYNINYTKTLVAHDLNEVHKIINSKSDDFHYLDRLERENLTKEELVKYYKFLKEYYISLTDKKRIEKSEKFYKTIYPILNVIFKSKYKFGVINKEKIPNKKGLIFVSNHRDMIDPPMIMSLVGKRNIHLLLKAEFLDSFAASFLKKIGCIFVKRDSSDSRIVSKEEMIEIILNGGDVIMFPEGTRNKTESDLLDFKLGAVSIAQVTGAPIVPISIRKYFDDYSEKIFIEVGDFMTVNYTDDICKKNIELMEKIREMYNKNINEKQKMLKK